MDMEGNGGGFPYYYPHHVLHVGQGHGNAASEAPARLFPSPSSSTPGGEGAGNPALFPQSAVAAAGGRASAPAPAAEPVRRKRGRPRKYGPPPPSSSSSSCAAPSSAPCFSPPSSVGASKASVSSSPSLHFASSPPPRLAPGRKKAQQESVGKGRQSFTPHFLTIAAGEDVVQQIMLFVQQQRRAVCIISASGTISSVTLCQPAMSVGLVTYEGHFDIVTLSGSFLLTETEGAYPRTGGLSVSFSNEQSIVGGGVGGPLVAAGPVQVFAGSFLIGSDKNLAVPANMENTVNNISNPSPVEAEVSPTVYFSSTTDSTGRISTSSLPEDRNQSSQGSGYSFVRQPRAVHVMLSPFSTDMSARQESGQLGAAYRSPGDEHIHD